MRKKIILFLGLLLSIVAFGQETFNDAMKIPEKWSSWMSYEVLGSQYYRKNPASWDDSVDSMGYGEFGSGDERTIAFPKYNYLIKGCFLQGRLKDTWIVKVFDNSNGEKIILEGGAWYSNEICYVKGIHHLYTEKGEEKIYGTFILSNTDNQRLVFKKKDAQELEISCVSYDYYYGYYHNCPTLLQHNGAYESKIFVDGKTGNRGYSFFSATLSELKGDSVPKLFDALMLASHNATMSYSSGDIFLGKVHTNSIGDSIVHFDWLEGKWDSRECNRKVWIKNGIFYFSKKTNNEDFNWKEQYYIMPKGYAPKIDGYWDDSFYILNCDTAIVGYRDGRVIKGKIISKIEPSNNIVSQWTSGKLWYSNGDVYEGDFLTTNGPFFTGGKTILADGTVLNGDWISSYKLTSEQRDKVYEADNPSDAWKIISKVFYITYRNLIGTKVYDGTKVYGRIWIDVFSNVSERVFTEHCDKVLFEKKTGIYRCFRNDGSYEVVVEVDQEERPIQQDVYKGGELSYIVCYSWYSNGEIQSIKTYDGKGFLMKACNFFSDGHLRSAYEYCTGNNGGRILRKSKESHPTFGGYETKLYDLDGNYERSITWDIGEGDFWSSVKMAPRSMKENLKDCIEE